MPRSARPSSRSAVPDCGTQLLVAGHSGVNAAGAMLLARVKVVLAGTEKSTWKRYSGQVALSLLASHGSGAPAGGRIEPSMSPGSNAPTLVERRPVVTNVADVP